MSILKQISGIARAYPLITMVSIFFNYFISNDNKFLLFSGAIMLNDILNYILKNLIVKPILGEKSHGILGSGLRPKGARNCGLFCETNAPLSKSYGMPSGHSQNAVFFSTYIISKIFDHPISQEIKITYSAFFILLAASVMYSRIYFKCHTKQQVIIGGIIGLLLGLTYIKNEARLMKLLFKSHN